MAAYITRYFAENRLIEADRLLNQTTFETLLRTPENLELLKWCYSRKQHYSRTELIKAALEHGRLDFIDFLSAQLNDAELVDNFAQNVIYGNIDTVKQMYRKMLQPRHLPYHRNLYFLLAWKHGHEELAKWLYLNYEDEGYLTFSSHELYNAFCKEDRIDAIKWISERDPEFDALNYEFLISICCSHDSLEVAKWLYKIAPAYLSLESLALHACRRGKLRMVKWLASLDPIDWEYEHEICFREACEHGHLEVARYIHSQTKLRTLNGAERLFRWDKIFEHWPMEMWLFSVLHRHEVYLEMILQRDKLESLTYISKRTILEFNSCNSPKLDNITYQYFEQLHSKIFQYQELQI